MKSTLGLDRSWRKLLLLLSFSTLVAPVDASAQLDVNFEIITAKDVDVSHVSPIGNKVLKKMDRWKIGRSQHFVVFASSLMELSSTVLEAEQAFQRIGEWMGLEQTSTNSIFLVMIEDEALWQKAVKSHGLRHDSLALQIDRELYLKNDHGQHKRPDRIAHEIIHVRLAYDLPGALPLCVEEGLAGHYGWLCAVEFNHRNNVILNRREPAIAAEDLFGMTELIAIQAYPFDGEKARAFYRQSEELISEVASRIGPENIPDFVRHMATNDVDMIRRFREACGWDEQQLTDVAAEVHRRCLLPREP